MANLTDRAERAFLGALIAEPGRLADVPGLRAGDFATRNHQAIFTALTNITAVRPGIPAEALPALIAVTADLPDIGVQDIAGLAADSPDPDAAAVYGRMVQEAALRRELLAHAERLADTAGPDRGADPELDYLAALSGALERSTRNLQSAAEWETEPIPPSEDPRVLREELLLAALIQDRELAADAPAWLNPDLFTSPERREIYEAAIAVTQSGEPATELTIAWELARQTAISDTMNGQTTATQTPETGTAASLLADLATRPIEVAVATQIGRDLLADQALAEIRREISILKHNAAVESERIRGLRPAEHDATRQRPLTHDGEPALIKPPAPELGHDGPQLRQ